MHFQGRKSTNPHFILKMILIIIPSNHIMSSNSLFIYTHVHADTYTHLYTYNLSYSTETFLKPNQKKKKGNKYVTLSKVLEQIRKL